MSKKLSLCVLVVLCALAAASVAPAASPALITGATANAFGVRVHAITFLGDPSISVPPTPLASSTTAGKTNDIATIVGPLRAPADGSILADARALVAEASHITGAVPSAKGDALIAHVALLETAGIPMISAEAVHAVSSSKCTGTNKASVSAAGSRLAGLTIAGQTIDPTPAPNTEVPLIYDGDTPADPADDLGVRVILNEQTPAANGAGLIVTMIHVIAYSPTDPLNLFIDVRVAEAFSSVFCGVRTPPSGANNITIGKIVSHTSSDTLGALDGSIAYAHRGELVTWRSTIKNTSAEGCLLHTVIDSLPEHFSFVSSTGRLSKAATPKVDGTSVTWAIGGPLTLGPGATLIEFINARVDADAPYGTYTNLLTLDESTCSARTSGLAGPVTIVPKTKTVVRAKKVPVDLPATGQADLQFIALLALIGAAGTSRLVRRSL